MSDTCFEFTENYVFPATINHTKNHLKIMLDSVHNPRWLINFKQRVYLFLMANIYLLFTAIKTRPMIITENSCEFSEIAE